MAQDLAWLSDLQAPHQALAQPPEVLPPEVVAASEGSLLVAAGGDIVAQERDHLLMAEPCR